VTRKKDLENAGIEGEPKDGGWNGCGRRARDRSETMREWRLKSTMTESDRLEWRRDSPGGAEGSGVFLACLGHEGS